jgi:signal transduction histidine kinase
MPMRRLTTEQLPRLSIALLVVAIVLLAALLLELHSSAQAHRATARRAVQLYAGVAVEELGTQVLAFLRGAQFAAFQGVAGAMDDGGDGRPLEPAAIERLVHEREPACRCRLDVEFAFRYDHHDSTFAVDQSADMTRGPDPSWVAEMRRVMPRFLLPRPPQPPAGRRSAPARPRGGRSAAMLSVGTGHGERLVMIETFHGADGTPVTSYGAAVSAEKLLEPIFTLVLRSHSLLHGVLRELPNDSLLVAEVRMPSGRVVYTSDSAARSEPGTVVGRPYVGVDTLARDFGALQLVVALRPEIAEGVLLGGVPRSRLPIIVLLFTLTAAIGIIVVVLFRRQQELVRSRAEFVSGVSHELRTPLSQIRLLAELLSLGQPPTEAGRQRAAKTIDQEARRLTHLVDNVLHYAASERGIAAVFPEPVDLGDEVVQILSTFAPLVQSESARVHTDAAPGVIALVDRAALRQIVLNLLDNALRYGPQGQTIDVSVQRIGDWARLSIADEGPGIPAAERARVWRPYYRILREDSPTRGGSGLGLAVVLDAVRAQGGRATIVDAPRGGAQFDIDFPIATEWPASSS